MAEYICEFHHGGVTIDGWSMRIDNGIIERERIVRCRDCEHYKHVDAVCDRFGGYPSAIGVWFAANPDCYCAWGERREEAG